MLLRHRGSKRAILWLIVFTGTAAYGTAAYWPDRSTELRRLFPDLSPAIASHLVNDDAEQFERFATRTGYHALIGAFRSLTLKLPTASMPEFLRAEGFAEPYVHKLLDALDRTKMLKLAHVFYEAYSRHTPEERIEIIRLQQAVGAFETDQSSVEMQARTVCSLIERAKQYPDVLNVAHLYARYAAILSRLQREDEIPHCFQIGIDAALTYGDTNMACQLLGSLGIHHKHAHQFEEMRRSWDRALAIARASGSWQEARILVFYSNYYRSLGQLAIVRDLVLEAQDRSHALGVEALEPRFAIDVLHFFAELEYWGEVGRGLHRVEMVYRESRSQLSPGDAEHEGARLQALRAWYCAATSRCEEALKRARTVVKHVERWSLGPTRAAAIRLEAARALATCGATAEARMVLERALEQCPVPERVGSYVIELAQVCLDLGDLDACQRTLDAHPPEAASRESVEHGILRLRLAMLRNDRPDMFVRLQEALGLLDAMEAGLGASPESYIALAATDELRRLGHELLDDSPEAGYAFEMRWRRPVGLGPRFSSSAGSEAAIVSALAAETEEERRRLAARGAVHCIYDVRDSGVVRVTADGGGVRQERLACSPSILETLVERVCDSLAVPSPRSDAFHQRQEEDLRQLATWLLPDSLRQSSKVRLLLVTANGSLARLPFEVLNVGPEGYVPLLDRVDVASIRHWGNGGQSRGDSALVVSEPVYTASLRRRYSILTEELPASAAEAATARRLLPRSAGLSGPAATKHNIAAHWRRARVIYFTGHSIQDPELPYVMFIPVSESIHGDEGDSYLEVADIRNSDLSNCQLVVLSSCASGAPYLDGKVVVPSLADVFIDAGARTVVSTRWAVGDDAAARAMTSFLRFYTEAGGDPIVALGQARRAMAADSQDPHIWAAYSITLGGLFVAGVGPIASVPLEPAAWSPAK